MTTTTSKRFGYIRVSTVAQNLDRQTDALTAAGIDAADIYSDKISGTRTSRPGLGDLLSRVRPGDSITVHSLDRLGRSALHVFQTIADLEERGVTVHSLKESEAALTGATGDFVRKLMVLVAELERNMNAERVAEARAARAARAAQGQQVAGRPRTVTTPANVKRVLSYRDAGNSMREIARLTGLSSAAVHRIIAGNRLAVASYDPGVHGDESARPQSTP
ncbi:recombinase family protein [Microbacterium sp. NPDC089318]